MSILEFVGMLIHDGLAERVGSDGRPTGEWIGTPCGRWWADLVGLDAEMIWEQFRHLEGLLPLSYIPKDRCYRCDSVRAKHEHDDDAQREVPVHERSDGQLLVTQEKYAMTQTNIGVAFALVRHSLHWPLVMRWALVALRRLLKTAIQQDKALHAACDVCGLLLFTHMRCSACGLLVGPGHLEETWVMRDGQRFDPVCAMAFGRVA